MAAFRPGPHEELLDLYDRMIGAETLDDAFEQVRLVLCEAMDAEAATVYLVRPETRMLEASGPVHNVVRTIRVPSLESSIAGCCHGDVHGVASSVASVAFCTGLPLAL